MEFVQGKMMAERTSRYMNGNVNSKKKQKKKLTEQNE